MEIDYLFLRGFGCTMRPAFERNTQHPNRPEQPRGSIEHLPMPTNPMISRSEAPQKIQGRTYLSAKGCKNPMQIMNPGAWKGDQPQNPEPQPAPESDDMDYQPIFPPFKNNIQNRGHYLDPQCTSMKGLMVSIRRY